MQQQPLDGQAADVGAPESERGGYPPDLAELRREVFRRDGYRCRLCGQEGGPRADGETVELHAHYTIPPAEGGSSSLDNLLTLCDPCHARHHGSQQPDDESAGASAGSSVGGLVVSWGTLLVLSLLSATALSWTLGEPIVDVDQYVALAGAGVLLALSLRLLTTWRQVAVPATAGTVGAWAVVVFATDELGPIVGTAEPAATFLVLAVLSVVPILLHRQFGLQL